ncbi:MAG: hypothetical protein EAZ95_14560, partial [Bacteroidetes bacterium]
MIISRDILWKGIIEDLFDDFLWYFLPDLAQNEVDFSQGFEFLDKELDSLLPENERSKRHADKLVKFYTKTNKIGFALLHIEVQGYPDAHFAERMYEYSYRIRDRWKCEVCSFVLYTDNKLDFHPTKFEKRYYTSHILYEFGTFDLSQKSEAMLEVAGNPFSIVMKVAKKAIEKGQLSDKKQLVWKVALTKELYQAGYSRKKIQHIFDFLRFYVTFATPNSKELFDQNVEPITKPVKPMGI